MLYRERKKVKRAALRAFKKGHTRESDLAQVKVKIVEGVKDAEETQFEASISDSEVGVPVGSGERNAEHECGASVSFSVFAVESASGKKFEVEVGISSTIHQFQEAIYAELNAEVADNLCTPTLLWTFNGKQLGGSETMKELGIVDNSQVHFSHSGVGGMFKFLAPINVDENDTADKLPSERFSEGTSIYIRQRVGKSGDALSNPTWAPASFLRFVPNSTRVVVVPAHGTYEQVVLDKVDVAIRSKLSPSNPKKPKAAQVADLNRRRRAAAHAAAMDIFGISPTIHVGRPSFGYKVKLELCKTLGSQYEESGSDVAAHDWVLENIPGDQRHLIISPLSASERDDAEVEDADDGVESTSNKIFAFSNHVFDVYARGLMHSYDMKGNAIGYISKDAWQAKLLDLGYKMHRNSVDRHFRNERLREKNKSAVNGRNSISKKPNLVSLLAELKDMQKNVPGDNPNLFEFPPTMYQELKDQCENLIDLVGFGVHIVMRFAAEIHARERENSAEASILHLVVNVHYDDHNTPFVSLVFH